MTSRQTRWAFATPTVLVLCAAAAAARAEVKTVVERNASDAATAAFAFKNVPAPSKTDAATAGTFTLVDGRRDRNGGGIEALNDGKLPAQADAPADNFFFSQRSTGGR